MVFSTDIKKNSPVLHSGRKSAASLLNLKPPALMKTIATVLTHLIVRRIKGMGENRAVWKSEWVRIRMGTTHKFEPDIWFTCGGFFEGETTDVRPFLHRFNQGFSDSSFAQTIVAIVIYTPCQYLKEHEVLSRFKIEKFYRESS